MRPSLLAVDDEIHMLRLLNRIITERTPYRLVTTNNALEVPEILARQTFDVVLADLKMPGMDGLDILRWIKEHERSEEVIIITAFGSLETATEALSLGVFDYITKPFKKEQILYTIDRAVRWQQLQKENASLAGLFEREPFQHAAVSFKQEYLIRLEARCGGDRVLMAARSGLSPEEIAEYLDAQPGTPRKETS